MTKAKTLVGLDVHATKIVAAVLDAETGQLQTFGMSGDAGGAVGFCAGLARPVRVAYEAGPTGYGLARELAGRGIQCVVAAPSKIPKASGDRVKTDRRDAEPAENRQAMPLIQRARWFHWRSYSSWRRSHVWNSSPSSRPFGVGSKIG
jgi:transposase